MSKLNDIEQRVVYQEGEPAGGDQPEPQPEPTRERQLTPEEYADRVMQRQRELQEINDMLAEKTKDLNEEGIKRYQDILFAQPLHDSQGRRKPAKEVIDSIDPILETLNKTFPKKAPEPEPETEPEATPKKEPVPRDKGVVVESEDNEPFKLPEAAYEFETLEGYVAAHNRAYQKKKDINRYSTQLSVDS